jgi:hypothetical protein
VAGGGGSVRGRVRPGRVQGQALVRLLAVFALRVRERGPVPDLGADGRELTLAGAGPGRGDEDLLGLRPVFGRDGLGPPGQLQRERLGNRPLPQAGQQRLVLTGQRLDGLVLTAFRAARYRGI